MSINDIKALCLTNKAYQQICQKDEFWIKIFDKHDLKIYHYQDTIGNWIKEYKKVLEATIEAEDILKVIKLANIKTMSITGKPINIIFNSNVKVNDQMMNYESFKDFLIDLLYDYPNVNMNVNYRYFNMPLRKDQLFMQIKKLDGYAKIVALELYHY